MWEEFSEQLVPLFEFLGIPMIILTPLVAILIVLFKYALPKMLSNNSNKTGMIVANIVAQLFGEGTDVVKGVGELELIQLIKSLPKEVQDVFIKTDHKLNQVTELVALMSQAIMSERLIKPQSSVLLREVIGKANEILEEASAFVEKVVEDDVNVLETNAQETKEV